MKSIIALYKARRQRKQSREFLRHVVHLRRMREDILPDDKCATCKSHEDTLRVALKGGSNDAVAESRKSLYDYASTLFRDQSHASLRENLEIIAVAIAVAMAARTYFIQPFKIPTGSMQPSLYGITHQPTTKTSLMDFAPLRPVKWLGTGKWYKEVVAERSGPIRYHNIEIPIRIGEHIWPLTPASVARIPIQGEVLSSDGPMGGEVSYSAGVNISFNIGANRYDVPAANFIQLPADGTYVAKGTVLWRGHKVAGDHVFVDKVRWNFQRPRRGQIMVFRTDGMTELEEGLPRSKKGKVLSTHYIKRMIGLPNELINIRTPTVEIDGVALTGPETIARIINRDDPYIYAYEVMGDSATDFQLGEGEYYALGDNTVNSKDSRYWGQVPERNLVGPAFLVYWPFSDRWGYRD